MTNQKKKTIKSIVLGKPTIESILMTASGLEQSFQILLKEWEYLKLQKVPRANLSEESQKSTNDNLGETFYIQNKYMGLIMGMNILLPFVCELGLTALYLLDSPTKKDIPKEHSLLYWWNHLKQDTQNLIIKQFEVKSQEEEIKEILKWNDKSHTEWRYWWRKGCATGGPASIGMQHLTKIIINTGQSYPPSDRNRVLNEHIDGHKEYDKIRETKRNKMS